MGNPVLPFGSKIPIHSDKLLLSYASFRVSIEGTWG